MLSTAEYVLEARTCQPANIGCSQYPYKYKKGESKLLLSKDSLVCMCQYGMQLKCKDQENLSVIKDEIKGLMVFKS